MKTYRGYRLMTCKPHLADGECLVNVEGPIYTGPLPVRTDLYAHCVAFWWGCLCSGSAQLAVALVADALGDSFAQPVYCQCFRAQVVDRLPRDGWILTETEIREAMDAILVELGQP